MSGMDSQFQAWAAASKRASSGEAMASCGGLWSLLQFLQQQQKAVEICSSFSAWATESSAGEVPAGMREC